MTLPSSESACGECWACRCGSDHCLNRSGVSESAHHTRPCEHEPEITRRGGCVDCHHSDVHVCARHRGESAPSQVTAEEQAQEILRRFDHDLGAIRLVGVAIIAEALTAAKREGAMEALQQKCECGAPLSPGRCSGNCERDE